MSDLTDFMPEKEVAPPPTAENAAGPTAEAPLVKPPPIPTVTTTNLVASCSLGVPLELRDIAVKTRNAEYNPGSFPACVMRLREPKACGLVYGNGKMVVTGTKRPEDAKLASKKFARIIQKLGFDVQFQKYAIQNIVGSMDVRYPIHLETVAIAHPEVTRYEPEIFAGLSYFLDDPPCCCILFCSGKVLITGNRSPADMDRAARRIAEIIAPSKPDMEKFVPLPGLSREEFLKVLDNPLSPPCS
eukprot:NODE_1258_length_1005_cov_195.750000_g967_i0.p1 GENE.NODE_1258_length_1005_cov_195.750000_g967_i0~~NODE_1258_length_1005_cov_195.750000_g967_i0.p1  ORF type:complete len:244 (+),score=44.14 NODE_1258_length_1005_cov_195.750000_g967_i0:73-804(+)